MDPEVILNNIISHVRFLYELKVTESLSYHNLEHTQQVVSRCTEISNHYQLDDEQSFLLQAAAWFHDVGHLYGFTKGHEEVSALKMIDFLFNSGYILNTSVLKTIEAAIMATSLYRKPVTFIEKIICDADTYHFGTPQFKVTDQLMRKEMELRLHKKFPHWYQDTLTLLKAHQFHTTYCQEKLNEGKKANIAYIEALTIQMDS